ncbi:MAG: hypothetical protein NT077_01000 [Candidatus Taylorbacteria bacterium]|nr:hypothetical protein [Candidatus Taylorbacteria bacterium]
MYDLTDIEFALVEVPEHSYYFEAEIVTSSEKAHTAEVELLKTCKDMGLKTFTDETFFAYIETLNEESNSIFEYKDYQPGYFRDKKYLKP